MVESILVVEDEPDMLAFLVALLEDNGYETMTASDGCEALQKIKTSRPDLIALDLLMPNKAGADLFVEIRTDPDTARIPIVLVTGLNPDDPTLINLGRLIQGRELRPPEAYIEKPVDPPALLDAVKKAIVGA